MPKIGGDILGVKFSQFSGDFRMKFKNPQNSLVSLSPLLLVAYVCDLDQVVFFLCPHFFTYKIRIKFLASG
jgi:hypothetical protein